MKYGHRERKSASDGQGNTDTEGIESLPVADNEIRTERGESLLVMDNEIRTQREGRKSASG